jgi:hypothetical protein
MEINRVAVAIGTSIALAGSIGVTTMSNHARAGESPSRFPTVPPEHRHARALLENAMRYVAPATGMIDPASGYPFEGWNQDPPKGLFLRSFTQLTAIGQHMELLANVVAGYADTPGLSREQALANLTKLVASLRQDQRDPGLSARGLLVNFLDLAGGRRLGPLASNVDKKTFLDRFGPEKGTALWKALQAKGWIASRNEDREADIQRGPQYGTQHFDGPLAPFADDATKTRIMAILDQRVVMVILGDNANLSASAAKSIGALLAAEVKDRPEVVAIREELGRFLDDQKEGYARMYDDKAGLLYFGWDATRDRLYGWEDLQGKWVTGHMDYLVNEFRGPVTFVVMRYGLPADAIKNLGFKMKPYRTRDGRELYALAPWEGSAFQAMGLNLMLGELSSPSWRLLLENVVDIEVDFATRHGLPGFLSESYTGNGTQYTGDVGIPEITVNPRPRITDAASLYALGVAYSIAPAKVERFLEANWSLIAEMLTDHGPWEGNNVTKREVIKFQTTAHTLALILGLLGTGSEEMGRYLESRNLGGRLAEFLHPGGAADLLSGGTQAVAWTDKDHTLESSREDGAFRIRSGRVTQFGIAFIPTGPRGVDLSGGLLSLRYRSAGPIAPARIELKPTRGAPVNPDLIPKEISVHLADTGGREQEIRVPLPATPGLSEIKEVVITPERATDERPLDLTITTLRVDPIPPSRAEADGVR